MKNIMKVNNGGGIQIENYDNENDIVSVFTGMEFFKGKNLVDDFLTYGVDWDYDSAGGNTNGYHINGNINGDINHGKDQELTANDVVDNHESTKIIAEWNGETLSINECGFCYFGINQD